MMSKANNFIFIVLKIIAWVIFVGLCIEAAALLVNFIFAVFNPELVSRLYQKMDLSDLYKNNKWAFYQTYLFILSTAILKAVLFYWVIKLLHKLNLSSPFTESVSKQIIQISYYTLVIGLLGLIGHESIKKFFINPDLRYEIRTFLGDSEAFILMGAVIYIIAVIFKKGVALQHENELTV